MFGVYKLHVFSKYGLSNPIKIFKLHDLRGSVFLNSISIEAWEL